MRVIITIFNVLFLIFVLGSCATQVTSIKANQNKQLDQGKGFLLLGVETNRNLKLIRISGPENIELSSKDIKSGTNYLLVDLESGTYTIDRVSLDQYWYLDLDDEEQWEFEVVPGKISYVGHFELVRRGYWFASTSAELVNRSSEALEFLEDDYKDILANNKIEYAGPGQDPFFKFLVTTDKE